MAALDLLFPALCPVCHITLGPGRRDPLCGPCWDSVERITPPWCDRCGRPFGRFDDDRGESTSTAAAPEGFGVCGACALDRPAFDWARSAAIYSGTVREAIHALKFNGTAPLARPLGALIVEGCGAGLPAGVTAVVPVPLARARERERGYNQASLLAERIARDCGVPLHGRWLARLRDTPAQSDLTAAERRANVRHAFGASSAVRGAHVVLVDDVMTTGATVSECACVLRAAGASAVGVLTVARVL